MTSEPALRGYQQTAVTTLLKHPRFLLADAPGAGKTPTTLDALRRSGASRVLVVAPNAVVHQWVDEAAIWWPEAFVHLGTGTPMQRQRAREAVSIFPPASRTPVVLVTSYDLLRRDVGKLAAMRWDCLVLDEAHRIKSRRALQTRAAWRLSKVVGGLWELTGSRFKNRPDELWSLLYALDPKRWPHFWPWVRQYMWTTTTSYGRGYSRRMVEQVVPDKDGNWLRPGAEKALHDELATISLHRTLEEIQPELPPETPVPLDVELDPDERRHYDELRKRDWTRFEDGSIVQAVNTVSRDTRLRQIVGGMEAFAADRPQPGSKLRAALEKSSDLDPEQVVTLTWSRAAAERIAREEPSSALVHGGIKGADRREALAAFRSGKVRVLVGTLATLGEGVDGMQVAQHLILVDQPWSPEDRTQAVGRLRRSGQQKPVFVYDVTALRTIDVRIKALVAAKRRVIDAVRLGEFEK